MQENHLRQARRRHAVLDIDTSKEQADLLAAIAELQQEQRRDDDAQLVAQLRHFLERQSAANVSLAASPHAAPPLRDGETPSQAVARDRFEIASLERELHNVRRAPLPRNELKTKAREFVAELAKAGAPSLIIERGEFRVDWLPAAWTTSGTLAPAGAPIMAWLFPDQSAAALEKQIDDAALGDGLPAFDRPRREALLTNRIAILERDEESLIEQANKAGQDVARRPLANPFAVLAVAEAQATSPRQEVGEPQRQAS